MKELTKEECNNLQVVNFDSTEEFTKFIAYSMFYDNKTAMEMHKKETAFKKIPVIDKGLRELAEFKEATSSNRGGYYLVDYVFDNNILICVNGFRLVTKHIRLVEVSSNTFKLKIFKNYEKREHRPFKLEDVETFTVEACEADKTRQTSLGRFLNES